ncbi:hypothetical protein CS022_04815 [Veronia nyctiphanis]|uniref:Uncharacterized protein n=1 Tax=Veronia nyctiphanis TaxID=1278244 RepID=A0A4V1LT90_9GAMM|nr:hypothetical protein CS022_04815 [Veronia nyctiphanis]
MCFSEISQKRLNIERKLALLVSKFGLGSGLYEKMSKTANVVVFQKSAPLVHKQALTNMRN